MNIPLEKWLVMAVLTAISIFLGMLPHIIVRHSKSILQTDSTKYKVILTILSCFGGGVLFSTSMLHLLPEVREAFDEIPSVWETLDHHFPLAEAVVILGFVLIYIVEEIAHFIMVDGHHGHHHHMNTVVRHNSIAHSIPIPNVRGSLHLITPRGSISTIQTAQSQQRTSFCITIPEDSTVDTGSISRSINNNTNNNNTTDLPSNSTIMELTPAQLSSQRTNVGRQRTYSNYSDKDMRISESTDTMELECPDDKANFASSLRTFLALIALSFHAIMEGITVGLQDNSNVWMLFGAVASHKFVISFCMGMELVASQARTLTYVSSIVFFSVLSPIGIIIGSLLATEDAERSVVVTVIEGAACGTLLYVVFFEILARERERRETFERKGRESFSMSNSKVAVGFIQFVALLVGLVSMGCLVTLTHASHGSDDDEHNHEHDH